MMTHEELGRAIFNSSHLTGEFVLRSGKISHEYFDKYQFESDPILLKEIAVHMVSLLPDSFDVLAGLEVGGIPIATALSLETNKPLAFIRKKPKEHGTKKFAEGIEVENKHLVIIEDVVTSGGQVIISTSDLRKIHANISLALCVIDRESGGAETLSQHGIELRSLFKMSELKSFL